MTTRPERIAYYNGEFLPEGQIAIPFRDRGFRWGDGCYDMARTFNHRPFKLKEHIERLYRSLRYLRIDLPLSPDELTTISEEVLARNLHLLGAQEDYWITQRISRGVDAAGDEGPIRGGPTIIVECCPIPYRSRAHLYLDGIELLIPSVRRTPPSSLSPRAKSGNYLNHTLADLEVKARNPRAWALFLDQAGNLCEGTSNNVFLVSGGKLLTPREQFVLGGVSRQTVFELASELGVPCEERDIDLYDAANADEIFLTMTSMCICPVRSLEGTPVLANTIPGPVTRRLQQAWMEKVGCDFIDQFTRTLDRPPQVA
ncbi:aminotransferase class IV [Mesorhizobium sp. M0114]|uniref:aminotransferase class IV n=1 Tax=unclassified Mesorhizobium TaxID=325217 RepID=UPI00333E0F41